MDCKEVFETFEKCGGKLICNYKTKQCFVPNTNLECTIKNNKDSEELDWMLWKHRNTTFGIPRNGIKVDENIHRYQNSNIKGFVIDLLNK